MLKKIALVLALVIPASASADRRVYSFHATRRADYPGGMGSYRSCGATGRMLKDKHVLRVADDGSVTIDGFKWRITNPEPDLQVAFHDEDGQKTYLMFDLYVNQRGLSGRYILWGVIPDPENPRVQEECVDAVYVDGNRL